MEASALQQKTMEMATNKCRKQSKDKQLTSKKKKVNRFDFLTNDILSEILKRLPEDFLRYQAKHVCTRWFNIVTNGILLDHASFIIQTDNDSTVRHVNITEQQQGLEVKEQDLEIPLPGRIVSWCNEFLLVTDWDKNEYVFNLITKEGSFLPHCTSCEGNDDSHCGVSLYFDRFKGVYKVLHVFMGPPVQCHVLILRKNILSRLSSNWNKIEVPSNINEKIQRSEFWGDIRPCYWGEPVSVRGRYFHWNIRGDDRYLVSMDLVKEKVLRISLPDSVTTYGYTVFEMGGFLTLLHQVEDEEAEYPCSYKPADMWILKEFDGMKWEKLELSIPDWCFGEYFKYSDAVSSVISKRYLMCMRLSSWDGGICSYDLKDWHVKELDIKIGSHDRRVFPSSTPSFI